MSAEKESKTTHFGFEEVAWSDKAKRVRGVFDSVAPRYDLMND
ncbi:MAG: bifunctional demethylmenaquinone methyltransferase/2-methoxy-6-polyprenyl-1,4-benzoquinol methylase, partial [Steroidobacteraceae bacterium]